MNATLDTRRPRSARGQTRSKAITFVLPSYLPRPNGGYRVVYEYASRLQARGHQVTIVHPYRWTFEGYRFASARAWRWRLTRQLFDRPLGGWFPHHPGVRFQLVPDLDERHLPDGDAVFATAWQTAPWVAKYGPSKGRKFYLIQHYETWAGPPSEVDATWRLPLHKVVIARWLLELANQFGEAERVTYIPNGLDLDRFRLLQSIESRNPLRIGMLYHGLGWKGSDDGIAALTRVREVHPDLDAVFFGTQARTERIPKWVTYVENPSHEELIQLYNSCAIFLHPSHAEGWPLPPAEAMACGCALVAAANQGVQDYTSDATAVLVPIKQPDALAEGLLRLLADDGMRQEMATAGHRKALTLGWDRAVDEMEELLTDCTARRSVDRRAGGGVAIDQLRMRGMRAIRELQPPASHRAMRGVREPSAGSSLAGGHHETIN